MKQDLVFLAYQDNDDGEQEVVFKVADIFGNNPVRDWDDEIEIGSWYQVGLVEKEGKNKKKYINVGTFDKVSSDGLPQLREMVKDMSLSIYDVDEADADPNYNYMVVRGQIRNIAPIPVWDDDMTKPVIHLKDRNDQHMYDEEGAKIMGYPQAIVGYENLKQKNLQGKEELYTMYFRLQDAEFEVDDPEDDVFFEARFHNQHFGKTTVELDFDDFLDEDSKDDDPEELATLIGDHLALTPVIAVVKVTGYRIDKDNSHLTWVRSNGLYIDTL